MIVNSAQTSRLSKPPLAERLDAIRDRFEVECCAVHSPRIESYLDECDPPTQPLLFRELLSVELAYRRRAGERPTATDYIGRFPGLAAAISDAFDLSVCSEACQPTLLPETSKTCTLQSVSAASQYVDLQYHAGGGLGEVFVARDGQFNRRVAVKFIRDEHSNNDEVRQRFAFEAQVAARLDHPGVAPVYTVGESRDGRPFYAMRFIRGEKLTARIASFHRLDKTAAGRRARRLELCALLRHLTSAAHTIAYAHHCGVAHLDVKPDNIMIGSYGETLVVDWGLAVPVSDEQRCELSLTPGQQTRFFDSGSGPSGGGAGTLPFMSPEQCDETWGAIGPASDVYALGVTLYYLLTNQTPFHGRDFDCDYKVPKKLGRYQRPSQIDRQAPRALEAICQKAMEPRPEERYQKATDFAADLEHWLADETVSVHQETWIEGLTRAARRHRNWATSIAAAVLMVLCVALLAACLLARAANEERTLREEETQERIVAQQALRKAEEAREASLRMAAHFAARTVASEVDLRLRILEAKAADARLRELLLTSANQPRDSLPRKQLQAWLEDRKRDTQTSTKADCWFIADGSGVLLARANYEKSILDQPFWYRDYFHGRGLDLPTDYPREDVQPIRDSYISNIYRAKPSGRLMVAFVEPIWNSASDNENGIAPLGILAMAVDVGEFRVLQTGLDQRQTATLVSLRPDVVDQSPNRGMILHHPRLLETLGQKLGSTDGLQTLPRLDANLVDRLEDLRRRRHDQLLLDVQVTSPTEGSLERAYHDVLAEYPEARNLAVFEPVFIPWREEHSVNDPGWVVIVHERDN